MTSDSRSSTDQIGKVFRAVGRDLRQCLVCEQLFGRQAAAEHAEVTCHPAIGLVLPKTCDGTHISSLGLDLA